MADPIGPPLQAEIAALRGSTLSVPWLQWFNRVYGAGGALSAEALAALEQIDLLYQAPPVVRPKQGLYGSFFDTTAQTTPANTPKTLTFNTTDVNLGVYIGTPTSRVYVTDAGIYNAQFSVQIENINVALQDVDIWLRVNGVDVVGSNGKASVNNKHGASNGHQITGWNFILRLAENDYFEIVWCPSSADVTIQPYAATVGPPAIPSTYSVVLTVTQANVSIPA